MPSPPLDPAPFTLDLTGREPPLSWAEVFGNDHPVELEVGSGKGLFLVNAATRNPAHNFLGIELARKYAGKAAERLAKRALPNAKVLPGDARVVLGRFVPPGSLRAVHIYFPDPWWKKRHKKRRVFAAPFVADVQRGLCAGGDFWMATDVEEYFGVMTALMAQYPRFVPRPPPEPNAPEHDLDYLTNFERKYRIEGRPIFRAHYRLG
ncbi:MAG TPA: tRNA (guanosine(46)-N7)-methyltransferase TrmB [Isosphaeraceae bacterium]